METLTKQLNEALKQIVSLQSQVNELSAIVNKNNFSSTQVFNKACIFNDRLKVPSYSAAPTVAEVNDIIGINGELYICTDASVPTFALVGTQS